MPTHTCRVHDFAHFIGKIYIEKMIPLVRLMSELLSTTSDVYKYKSKLLLNSLTHIYVLLFHILFCVSIANLYFIKKSLVLRF